MYKIVMCMTLTYEYDTHWFLYVMMYKITGLVTGTIYM